MGEELVRGNIGDAFRKQGALHFVRGFQVALVFAVHEEVAMQLSVVDRDRHLTRDAKQQLQICLGEFDSGLRTIQLNGPIALRSSDQAAHIKERAFIVRTLSLSGN
jgi:hypothetical protein